MATVAFDSTFSPASSTLCFLWLLHETRGYQPARAWWGIQTPLPLSLARASPMPGTSCAGHSEGKDTENLCCCCFPGCTAPVREAAEQIPLRHKNLRLHRSKRVIATIAQTSFWSLRPPWGFIASSNLLVLNIFLLHLHPLLPSSCP